MYFSRTATSVLSAVIIVCLSYLPVLQAGVIERVEVPSCPSGARPMLRPDGNPRKCLPHQNSLCVNALPDQPNATTVCCWYNQVDYFCCLDVRPDECPDYHDVTVVIHHAYPQNLYALRSYHFREGIEDDIAALADRAAKLKPIRAEDGILVRHNPENQLEQRRHRL